MGLQLLELLLKFRARVEDQCSALFVFREEIFINKFKKIGPGRLVHHSMAFPVPVDRVKVIRVPKGMSQELALAVVQGICRSKQAVGLADLSRLPPKIAM